MSKNEELTTGWKADYISRLGVIVACICTIVVCFTLTARMYSGVQTDYYQLTVSNMTSTDDGYYVTAVTGTKTTYDFSVTFSVTEQEYNIIKYDDIVSVAVTSNDNEITNVEYRRILYTDTDK